MVSLRPTSSSPRFAQIVVLIIGLLVATSLSAQPYHLGGGTGAPPTEGSGSASASGSSITPTTYGPGNTDLGGGTVNLAQAIFNGGTVSNGTLAVSNGYVANSGEVTAILTGTDGLRKNTSDTFTISSASTYTGDTDIAAGTLKLGAGGSITSSPIISISSGATFDVADVSGGFSLVSGQLLAGSGSVAGALTVGTGATLNPGGNSIGTLTFTGGLALNGGATLNFGLGSTSDLIAVSGGVLTGPSSGAITLNLSDSGDFAAGTYTLFDYTGATFDGFDLFDFTLGTAPLGYDYSIDFNGSTLQLTSSAIPEPATVALGLGSAALVAVLVRRRRLLVRG